MASGTDDQRITSYAQTLKTFGQPVFLRWCRDMNLAGSHAEVDGPSGIDSAWVHIWSRFHQVGVTNVSFVWCPAETGADPTPYYPGDAYVGWAGIDGKDRSGTTAFADIFSAFYQQWAGHGKPMMVAETGTAAPGQATYLERAASEMPDLAAFKAAVYFDATGPAANWQPAGADSPPSVRWPGIRTSTDSEGGALPDRL